jgi:thymidylate synthase (FAD)
MKIAPIQVTYINHCGDDLSVVNAARVSFDKESDYEDVNITGFIERGLKEADVKLINYLAKHKHFSPFNHAFLSFRIKAPIFVARQLVKHKFMPWNEVSRRYVDSEPEFYIPEIRSRADNVKQGSSEDLHLNNSYWKTMMKGNSYACLETYNNALKSNVCAEQARAFLPVNMHTEWIWSGTLGAFADMLKLRLDPHTQKESRDVAELIYAEMIQIFPVSLKALLENK